MTGRSAALVRLDGPRGAALVTLVTGAGSAALGAALGREGAAWGGLLAALLVLASFWASALPLRLADAAQAGPGLGLVVLLLTYVLRLVALLGVLAVLARSGSVDVRWLAATLIACTLAWVGARVALLRGVGPIL